MRPWVIAAVAALGGCNWIYGLEETRNRDAGTTQFFDAPADAPFGCPVDGSQPLFKPALRQVPVPICYSYVPSYDAGRALAQCGIGTLAEGDIDAPMAMVGVGNGSLSTPRLFPEGDRAFAHDAVANTIHLLERSGDLWSDTGVIMPAGPADWTISNPTRGPDRRAIVINYDGNASQYQMIELAEVGGLWQPRDMYPGPRGYHPSITSDGLRIVFDTGFSDGLYYGVRPDLTARFTTFTRLSTAPGQSLFPFLSDDCGVLYFSALDTVFALEQR